MDADRSHVVVKRRRSLVVRVSSLDIAARFTRAWRSSKHTYSVHQSDLLETELTAEQERELEEIRGRREEVKRDIQRLQDVIRAIATEMEGMQVECTNDKRLPMERSEEFTCKLVNTGRKKFNIEPKKGIDFLVQQELLNEVPDEIASWLYRTEALDKRKIGEYLGENKEPNLTVLKEFVKLHEFTGMTLVQALRRFLWSFLLPGEAQKIDRMMEAFAQQYCACNKDVFSSTDTCYILSFSVIMLHTSLHSPSVKNKPTVEMFIQMNRGLDNGADLPVALLMTLYDSILKEPFKIPDDDCHDLTWTFFNPERQGWLTKEGGKHRSWKRRWFVLKNNCLYYFKSQEHKEPKGIIPLELLQVRDSVEVKRPHCFEIYSIDGLIKACKSGSDGKVVQGRHNTYRICADGEDDKDTWMKSIKASISCDPFYEMLQQRKKSTGGL